MKILLIEDDRKNAKTLARLLRDLGVSQVTIAITGLDGLEAVRQGQFDICIVDINLPDMDGRDIGLALCTLMARHHIPPTWLIALTAQTDKETLADVARHGFHVFIGKPCGESEFRLVLDRFRKQESVR